MGWGQVWVCRVVSYAHIHPCACACMHMHVKHDKHDKHGCLHVSSHLHVHACAGVWWHPPWPQMPPDTPQPTCPLPRAAGSPKHQNSISLELIEIFQFCLKILYLWTFWTHIDYSWSPQTPPPTCPTPQSWDTQIRRITITLERIEIIQFCLNIWDPWTLLHTYRLGLMCRWGGVLS